MRTGSQQEAADGTEKPSPRASAQFPPFPPVEATGSWRRWVRKRTMPDVFMSRTTSWMSPLIPLLGGRVSQAPGRRRDLVISIGC